MWVVILLFITACVAECPDGVRCFEVNANGLTFECRDVGSKGNTAVLLLHGFPEFARHWDPLLQYWVQNKTSIYAIACDLRGYSPKASPPNIDDYNYDIFVTDVYAIARAVGLQRFHLVGHDHGAGLGWLTAARDPDNLIISYTALSVAHPDALSKVVAGNQTDEGQQVSSMYFNQFSIPNVVSLSNGALPAMFGMPAEQLQKMMYWYHGSVPRYLARPPVFSPSVISKYPSSAPFVLAVQQAVPLKERPAEAQKVAVGMINVPTLFGCGSEDAFLLCTHPYAQQQREYVSSSFTYLSVKCEHNLLQGCQPGESLKVMQAITQHIKKFDTQ